MSPPTEPLVAVCGADAAYALPLGVMLHSVCGHLDPARRLDVHVLDGGLGEAGRARVSACVDERTRLSWHRPRRCRLEGLPVWGRISPATYDKLLIADVLPTETQRVLWLDGDLLVLDDLARLWDRPLSGHSALAARDAVVASLDSRFGLARDEARRHEAGSAYFNAGLLLIDLERWRRLDVARRAFRYLEQHRTTVSFWDQEGLNAALAGDWLELEPRWNVNVDSTLRQGVGDEERERLRGAASVLHFCGRQKPWRYLGRGAAFQLYYEALDRSGGAGWRPASSWSWRLLDAYARSPLRPAMRGLERAWMAWERRATRRYLTAEEVAA